MRVFPKDLRAWIVPAAVALFVGLCTVAPTFLARWAIGDAYNGIPFLYADDADFYLARMQEITEGRWFAGSPFLAEYTSQWSMQAPLSEALFYVLPSTILRISLPTFLVVASFLFPAILFLLVFRLARNLAREFLSHREALFAGIAAGVLVTLGYEFLPFSAWQGMAQRVLPAWSWSAWTRPVNPITGGILIFAFLNALLALEQRITRTRIAVASGLFALMIGYVFSWALTLALTIFSGIRWACARRWDAVRAALVILFAGILAVGLYAWGVFSSLAGVMGDDPVRRNGMLLTHAPVWNKFLWAGTIVFFATTWQVWWRTAWRAWRSLPAWWMFTATMLLAGHSAYLQQIVTGRTVWIHHFVQYTKPFALLAVVLGVAWLLRTRAALRRGFFGAIILVCAANGVAMAASSLAMTDDFRLWQDDAPLYAWLNREAPQDCVVLVYEARESRGLFIPAFTPCTVYTTTYVLMKIPAERLAHMFFVSLRMEGVTLETLPAWLATHEEHIRGAFYDSWHTLFARGHDAWLEQVGQQITKDYQTFLSRPFAEALGDYSLNYILVECPLTPLESLDYGVAPTPVFTSSRVWVYRVSE
ncbi:MAG: hypothetical protein RL141_642 [Candidatus Parcubacteria bacterium]